MKVALLTDTHWGVRNDHPCFHDNMKLFLDQVFFPRLRERGIKRIYHLGDLVDKRKHITYETANRIQNDFLSVVDRKFEGIFLVGNHDATYKNTNKICMHNEIMLNKYPNIKVLTETTHLDDILLIPWICTENRESTLEMISKSTSRICMGHLELAGFQMYKGSTVETGESPKIFDRFDLTLTGHFHHRSNIDNVHYIGAAGQYTWSDYDDPRGFTILDTDTLEMEFIHNPFTMFQKVFYDDKDTTLRKLMNINFAGFKNTVVKLVVVNKTNPLWFDKYVEQLEGAGPYDLQVVDAHMDLDKLDEVQLSEEAGDTVSLLSFAINQASLPNVDKAKLSNLMTSLYNQAISVDIDL